jgi:Amiloride-sensitive sodium channel
LAESTQAQMDVVYDHHSDVRIYFGELKYTEIAEDQLMNLPSFLASLGGVFGLCTGMSVVTIVQAFSLCIEYVLNKFRKPAGWTTVERDMENSGYLGRLDWHGLLDVYLAKKWSWRLYWATIILGSCATFTYYCMMHTMGSYTTTQPRSFPSLLPSLLPFHSFDSATGMAGTT